LLKQISNLLFYETKELENKIPKAREYFGNPFNDLPFLLIDDFLSADQCKAIVSDAISAPPKEAAMVISPSAASRVDTTHRSTDWRTISAASLEIYDQALTRQKAAIERFFGKALLEASRPQILGYKIGDFYDSHADNCSKTLDENGEIVAWKLVKPNRVITTLLFLNDDFDGGELVFDYFFDEAGAVCRLKPKAGLAVAFPSNPIFAHSVKPVLKGYRLTIAQWHNALKE
jgi:SM-20-related protein